MTITRERVEDFLFYEAKLLDEWKLTDWAELFTEDGSYSVPAIGYPDGDRKNTLFLISDDYVRLKGRAERLMKKEAHVEFPHSITSHNISNVRIENVENGVIHVECNFITYRTKREVLHVFIGRHKYKLVEKDGQLKILDKRVILNLDSLRPQGKVSFIL